MSRALFSLARLRRSTRRLGLGFGLSLFVAPLMGGCAGSSPPPGEAKTEDGKAEGKPAEEAKPAGAGKSAEATQPEEGAGLPDRDPALACRLVRKEGAVLLDVRTPEEFAEGHVEGAVNIPHGEIDARAAEIDGLQGGDKNTPIVVYCRSGRRSGIAKQSLIDGGRSQVSNVGGLSDWSECAE